VARERLPNGRFANGQFRPPEHRWPLEAWRLAYDHGASYRQIALDAGCHWTTVARYLSKDANHPPDPGPNRWDLDTRWGESPRERAFRRFPVVAHKPGGW